MAASDTMIPPGFKVLKEGMASILQKGNEAFYNEAQVTNRDLSIAMLRHFLPLLEREKEEGQHKGPRAQRHHKRQREQQEGQEGQQEGGQQEEGQGQEGAAEVVAAAAEGEVAAKEETAGKEEAASSSAAAQPAAAAKPSKGARVLEGLAATGLRSIRYALEVPGIAQIDANDLDPAVVASMRRNMAFNGPEVQAKVHCMCSDARLVMMQGGARYDAVDLDPYGTPSMLLDTAVQSVSEGGLLMVTATDMANLCGNNSTACWSNYSAYPIHRPFCHEMALRILLGSIEAHANRYRRHITPLLSLSVDFYVRVFVRITTSPAAVKDTPSKLAYVWQSSGCDSFWLQKVGAKKVHGSSTKYMAGQGPAVPQRCPETNSAFLMGGPIWADPIHDVKFVKGVLGDLERDKARYAQYARIKGMLSQAADELPDAPLYYNLHDMCKTVRCTPPKMELFRSALINAGYRVSSSHATPLAVKTDAPPEVLWDIIRCWVKDHPISMKKVESDSYLVRLLSKEPTLKANFTRVAAAMNQAKLDGVTRYVQNPAHWGPKSRHGRPAVVKGQGQQRGKGKQGKKEGAEAEAEGEGEAEGGAEAEEGGEAEGGKDGEAGAEAAAEEGAAEEGPEAAAKRQKVA